MTTTQQDHAPGPAPSAALPATLSAARLLELIGRRTVAHLATVSAAGRPHSAAVLYAAVGSTLYVSTDTGSRKARNIGANPFVGVSIPVRRLPFGPPS